MSLLSALKEKLGIHTQRTTDEVRSEVEPVHRPSFSIGNSLGDIKVGLMDLKARLERIEGSMLSREYFDHSVDKRDKSDLVMCKLDEVLRALAESPPRRPSIEPGKANLEPSLTEQAENHVKKAIESLRLKQVMTIFDNRNNTTPKQLAKILGIKNNTATEHLRELEKLGYVRRISRGLYEKS